MYVQARRVKKKILGDRYGERISRLKCPKLLNRVEVSNTNSQHKWIFVKYL